MSWDNLSVDILEEFAERTPTRPLDYEDARTGYGRRVSPEEARITSVQWRKDHAAYIASEWFRERAIQTTKRWREELYADPVRHQEWLARVRVSKAKWREANREAVKASNAASRRRRRAVKRALKRFHSRRNIRALAWATRQSGEFGAGEAVAALGVTRDNANSLLRRMARDGLLQRVRRGVYRRAACG